MLKKFTLFILGIVSIALGIIVFIDKRPAIILCGIGVILYAFGEFASWLEKKKGRRSQYIHAFRRRYVSSIWSWNTDWRDFGV